MPTRIPELSERQWLTLVGGMILSMFLLAAMTGSAIGLIRSAKESAPPNRRLDLIDQKLDDIHRRIVGTP
jgi:hypothetical protein